MFASQGRVGSLGGPRGLARLRGCIIVTLLCMVAPVVLPGCLKPTLATGDSIRTGSGSDLKYLLPRLVDQGDGSRGFCVYLARPVLMPMTSDTVGPGNNEGTEVLTRQSIPEAEFIDNLRNPELMKEAGGIGNSIAADVMTSVGTLSVVTAGLGMSQLSSWVSRGGAQGKELRELAAQVNARLVEYDTIIEKEAKGLVNGIVKEAGIQDRGTRDLMRQVINLLAEARPGDAEFLKRAVAALGARDPAQAQSATDWLKREFSRRRALGLGTRALTADEIGKVRLEFAGMAGRDNFRAKLTSLAALQNAQNRLAGGLHGVRTALAEVSTAMQGGASAQIAAALSRATDLVNGVDEGARTLVTDLTTNSGVLSGTSAARTLTQATTRKLPFWARQRSLANASPGTRGVVAGSPNAWRAQDGAVDRLRPLVADTTPGAEPFAVNRMLVSSSDEAATNTAAAVRRHGDFFGDLCWRGGSAAIKAGKVLLCGLAAGTGSFFLKKALFENPGTVAIKRDQIQSSLADENTFMEVNAETFVAVAKAIRGFPVAEDGVPCR